VGKELLHVRAVSREELESWEPVERNRQIGSNSQTVVEFTNIQTIDPNFELPDFELPFVERIGTTTIRSRSDVKEVLNRTSDDEYKI